MKTNQTGPLSPKVAELLRVERRIEPAPQALRGRALLRARSDQTAVRAPSTNSPLLPRRLRVIAPVVLGMVGLAAAAWVRWHGRVTNEPELAAVAQVNSEPVPSPMPSAAMVTGLASDPVASAAASAPESVPVASAAAQRVDHRALELALLDTARKATRSGDFATVLSVVREHEQRFPRGHLIEEREALRVTALIGLGRRDEAKRVAEGFRKRFPQSVLLPSVERMVGATR